MPSKEKTTRKPNRIETEGKLDPPVTRRVLKNGLDPSIGERTRFQRGQSGDPYGRPQKFATLLSDAFRSKLAEVVPRDGRTYAVFLAEEVMKSAAKLAKKGKISKELMWFLKKTADRVEGRPAQKMEFTEDRSSDSAELV